MMSRSLFMELGIFFTKINLLQKSVV